MKTSLLLWLQISVVRRVKYRWRNTLLRLFWGSSARGHGTYRVLHISGDATQGSYGLYVFASWEDNCMWILSTRTFPVKFMYCETNPKLLQQAGPVTAGSPPPERRWEPGWGPGTALGRAGVLLPQSMSIENWYIHAYKIFPRFYRSFYATCMRLILQVKDWFLTKLCIFWYSYKFLFCSMSCPSLQESFTDHSAAVAARNALSHHP